MTKLKVQFGAGGNLLEGWINYDNNVNIAGPLPYESGVVDVILIEHCLEHVNAPDGYRFMCEAYRILKNGGVLRICVPTLAKISDRAHAADLILGHGHQMVYSKESLWEMLYTAGFLRIQTTARKNCDGHWKIIGKKKDDLETLRVEATK